MGLVPRLLRPVFGVLVLLALTSLPTLRSERILGSAFTPRIAQAGGSPDETLNPKKTRVFITKGMDNKALRRWEIYYRVFRIFAQRLI